MRVAAKAGIVASCTVLLAAGGYGGYYLTRGGHGQQAPVVLSATPPAAPAAVAAAQQFLTAWQSGSGGYTQAAADTTLPTSAGSALSGYADGLKLSSIAFGGVTAGAADPSVRGAMKVAFTATATVGASHSTWSYPGSLDVVQTTAGHTEIAWSDSVLYPTLKAGQLLAVGSIPPAAGQATVEASDGSTLTAAKYPSLAGIITTIASSAEGLKAVTGDTPGVGVELTTAAGAPVSTVKVFTPATGGVIKTTINSQLQTDAEAAVVSPDLDGLPGSVVAVDRTNGHILAIAFSGKSGDTAINAELAPGSTMKIITSAALFDDAGLNPSSPAPCTNDVVADGQIFHNDDSIVPNAGTTVQQAFAESCNAAFIKDGYDDLVHGSDASELAKEADNVFGLGNWDIGGGVQTANPQVQADPVGSNAAADLIGQGTVTMNPLILASIAATVRDGAFHQPVILPGQPQPAAAQPLNPTTDRYLQQMMDFDAHDSSGTAYPRMNGIPGSGGKTGTAEVGPTGHVTTNGWFAAYDNNIAAAALVQGGATGVGTAGYIVQTLFNADH